MSAYYLYKNSKTLSVAFLLFLAVNIGAVNQALADMALDKDIFVDRYSHLIKATDEELSQQRGGFTLPNGMVVNISLERLIFLNGVETVSSFIQFPVDGVLIQNGSGNLGQDLVGSVLGSIIQNSLDDQVIKSINELNIEISNLPRFDLKSGAVISDLIMPTLQ